MLSKITETDLSNMMVILVAITKHSPHGYLEVIGMASLVGDWLKRKMECDGKIDLKKHNSIIIIPCNK